MRKARRPVANTGHIVAIVDTAVIIILNRDVCPVAPSPKIIGTMITAGGGGREVVVVVLVVQLLLALLLLSLCSHCTATTALL